MIASYYNKTQPLNSVQGLSVCFAKTTNPTIEQISFDLYPGEILGIVGESGSGKSVTCRALMGMLPKSATINGSMMFDGHSVDLANKDLLSGFRGAGMSMIFQDPMSALDPLMTVRRHLAHRTKSDPVPLLKMAGLSDPEAVLDSYAHQLSGGQCQRVSIACALAREPKVLIADEPTTALDVTVQKGILKQIRYLARERGMAVIFITHDLAVIYELCSRVLVMHKGRIVESGPVDAVLRQPKDDYTRELITAIPSANERGQRLTVSKNTAAATVKPAQIIKKRSGQQEPGEFILAFDGVSVTYPRSNRTPIKAVSNVSLSLRRGEILGLVGESGSGKSTLAKTAVGLTPVTSGRVVLNGAALNWNLPQMKWRRQVQYIFQDPRGALDPTARILRQVRMPLDIHKIGSVSERTKSAKQFLAQTELDDTLHDRKPSARSGGQRQRATIARALALHPEVLICDESVSALDVSIQARVLDLLINLRENLGIAILFISHDLGVVHHLCDRVAVMRRGEIVERGETDALFNTPRHQYTRDLLEAVPQLPKQIVNNTKQEILA